MGADIWLGRPLASLAYFRDSYTAAAGITLNGAAGLSYWQDLAPKLGPGDVWPLELNGWLLGEIRAGMAERLEGPDALQLAADYLKEADRPNADPAAVIPIWRAHIAQLIEMIEQSTATATPLYMSL